MDLKILFNLIIYLIIQVMVLHLIVMKVDFFMMQSIVLKHFILKIENIGMKWLFVI